jgi:hypothetical protein
MAAFHMMCSCGQDIKVDAKNRTDAVTKIQGMMDKNAIAEHMKAKHKGETVPTVAQVHQMIAQNTAAA